MYEINTSMTALRNSPPGIMPRSRDIFADIFIIS